MLFCRMIGKITKILGIKEEIIFLYEKLYDVYLTIQMYVLRPYDRLWNKRNHLNIMSIEETIEYILKNRCSISRFGDGEFNIVSGKSIGFQHNDDKLIRKLTEILKNPSNNQSCLVALPGIFHDEEDYEKCTRKFWNKILVRKRRTWYGMCRRDYVYGNADITRCYIELKDRSKSIEYFLKMKEIWNKRDVIIIEGKMSRLGIGNDLFDNCNSIKRILCPAMDAFSCYDKVIKYITENVEKDRLLLVALGPTATSMAIELSNSEYQTIDIGNIDKEYEWCINKNIHKTVNSLKFTMEVKGGTNVQVCNDEQYLASIIYEF